MQSIAVWDYHPDQPIEKFAEGILKRGLRIDSVTLTHYDENAVCISAMFIVSSNEPIHTNVTNLFKINR